MDIVSAKLTGNPGPSGWSQVHEFTPTEPEKLAARGRLYAVIGTGSQKEGVDSVAAGRELLARLHEEYFGKIEVSGFNALKVAVETVVAEFSQVWGDVEIAAVSFLNDVIYSVAAGGAQVLVVREGALARILTSTAGEVVSASGYPKKGDFLIFGTERFFEAIDAESLKSSLAAKDVGAAAEIFAPRVHSIEDSGNLAAIILEFKKGEVIVPARPVTSFTPPNEETSLGSKEKLSAFWIKTKGLMSKVLNKLPERIIYVKKDTADETLPDSKKTTLSVGAIILALLLISIAFGIRQRNIREVKGKYQDRLLTAEHSYDEALSLAELSPERARELFLESKTLAEQIKNEGIKDKKLETLLGKLNSSQGSILGEFSDDPELFLDLSILTSGFNGSDLAASGENLFVLDGAARRVVRIAIDTKKTETVAGPDDITSAERVAGYEDRSFVQGGDGVFEVGETEGRAVEDTWEGEVLPYVFGGNFYILEKGAGIIWRYQANPSTGSGFASKQNWFGAGVKPNFAGVVGMTIDGTIWVLSDNGRVQKFSQGSPQNFAPQGVNPVLSFATAIHTNEENNFIYVLDAAGKRVVVLQKDGKYAAQYVSDKIGEATDLAVSEKEGKMILLAGAKLYSISLKHL